MLVITSSSFPLMRQRSAACDSSYERVDVPHGFDFGAVEALDFSRCAVSTADELPLPPPPPPPPSSSTDDLFGIVRAAVVAHIASATIEEKCDVTPAALADEIVRHIECWISLVPAAAQHEIPAGQN